MIPRVLESTLRQAASWYPVVTVTGPRQSGKTTLCRAVFPDLPYVSLEALDVREGAQSDPRGFFRAYPDGAVIDEVQYVPELLSYLQTIVDDDPRPGRFVLTGSQHFGLSHAIAQSLAGRTAVLHLLPLGLSEVRLFPDAPADLWSVLVTGAYPRIHDRQIPADRWLADYVTTYVQRDVRQVLDIGDLQTLTTFLKLCAGRTAQEVNLSALGADAGVSHNTAQAWLSVLETSFLCVRLPAWHRNLRKRLVKASKLHFLDSGLACHLLGIRDADQLRHHPLRGPIFESWVATEIFKARVHNGVEPALHHFRESRGLEVDLVVEDSKTLWLVEAKSGATVNGEFFHSLTRLQSLIASTDEPRKVVGRLVHGGDATGSRGGHESLPWTQIASVAWTDGDEGIEPRTRP